MSLSEFLEQFARIFPFILKQSLVLREILCNTRGFFRCLASEVSALREALKFVMFLIIIDFLIYLPVDSFVWRIDPLSPPMFIASAIISSLSVLTLVISVYIAFALIFKIDSLLNCAVLSCYIYSLQVLLHIANFPIRFIMPTEILEGGESVLDIDLYQIEAWIQSLSYRDGARVAVVCVLVVVINIFVLAKLTLALLAYRRMSYLRAFLAMGLLLTVHGLLYAILVWPIFIGLVRLSR